MNLWAMLHDMLHPTPMILPRYVTPVGHCHIL